jgi:hypothetical protein
MVRFTDETATPPALEVLYAFRCKKCHMKLCTREVSSLVHCAYCKHPHILNIETLSVEDGRPSASGEGEGEG